MTRLEDQVIAWRKRPVPRGSVNDLLDDLHGELATVDMWVAETVIPFVDHGYRVPVNVDIPGTLSDFLDRISEFCRTGSAEERELAISYRDYAAQLLELYGEYASLERLA